MGVLETDFPFFFVLGFFVGVSVGSAPFVRFLFLLLAVDAFLLEFGVTGREAFSFSTICD